MIKLIRMKKLFLTCCTLIFITACVHGPSFVPQKMMELSIGMTKSEAMKIMEIPISEVRANSNTEYLIYKTHWDDFFIGLKNGKVYSYGKMGDFGSPRDPGPFDTDIKINQAD